MQECRRPNAARQYQHDHEHIETSKRTKNDAVKQAHEHKFRHTAWLALVEPRDCGLRRKSLHIVDTSTKDFRTIHPAPIRNVAGNGSSEELSPLNAGKTPALSPSFSLKTIPNARATTLPLSDSTGKTSPCFSVVVKESSGVCDEIATNVGSTAHDLEVTLLHRLEREIAK
jgi:hypothetical protein